MMMMLMMKVICIVRVIYSHVYNTSTSVYTRVYILVVHCMFSFIY